MSKVVLGRTGIIVNKNGFGALPIQRVSEEEAVIILRQAYGSGITFFDTARAYTDSEKKVGKAFHKIRGSLYIASKTMATTPESFWNDLEQSLTLLQTDYLDVYQFHNPDFCPLPGDGTGLYEAMLEAREKGMIRFIGFTNHRLPIAQQAVMSGLYDTLQFPFSYLASDEEIELVKLCQNHQVGFIAMKALSGGLITNSAAAYAWLDQFDSVLPIWGIQKQNELEEFVSYITNPPVLDKNLLQLIEEDQISLQGNFCRGCGYCMPCPVGIQINNCARMSQLIRRSPSSNWLSENGQKIMFKIENCIECGQCRSQCPYGLNTPELLKQNLQDYKRILAGEIII